MAVNPILAIDLAGGMACDTALVMQLCRLYNLPMQRAGARQLLAQLTGQNALLGSVQLGLAALKQLLLLAAPLSAGLSLAPAAPIAGPGRSRRPCHQTHRITGGHRNFSTASSVRRVSRGPCCDVWPSRILWSTTGSRCTRDDRRPICSCCCHERITSGCRPARHQCGSTSNGHRSLLSKLAEHFPCVATWASDNPLKEHAAPLHLRVALLEALVDEIASLI